MQVEEQENVLMSKEEILNKITTLIGGRAAEEVMFGSITSGASNDIEKITRLARAMVTRLGMSDKFGMIALETVTNQYLGGDASLACSPETSALIDKEVQKIVKECYDKAIEILTENKDKLIELSNYLLEKETITGTEFMELLNKEDKKDSEGNKDIQDSINDQDIVDVVEEENKIDEDEEYAEIFSAFFI